MSQFHYGSIKTILYCLWVQKEDISLNSTMVRLKRNRVQKHRVKRKSLNSTMVRLKLNLRNEKNEIIDLGLNSTMVRLKLNERQADLKKCIMGLNSTMVRLKLDNADQSYAVSFSVSIPLWFD